MENIKENGQAWTSQRHKGRQTTGRSGDSWFQSHRWCPNDTTGYGIDDDDKCIPNLLCYYTYTDNATYITYVTYVIAYCLYPKELRGETKHNHYA